MDDCPRGTAGDYEQAARCVPAWDGPTRNRSPGEGDAPAESALGTRLRRATRLGGSLALSTIGHGRLAIACLLMVVLSTSGCTSLGEWWHNGFKVGPRYTPPPGPVAGQWIEAADPSVKHEPLQDCAWWTVFNDPALNRLIDTAYRQNLDLRIAGARILEARAQRNIAVGNLFPQSQTAVLDFVDGQISKNIALPLNGHVGLWASGFNASWEADFWGRYRRIIETSDANLAASVDSYGDALVLLFSEVASNYVQLRTFEQRLQYARKNIEIQQGSLGLAEDRFKKGVATELDVRQARTNLAQTQSLIHPLEAGRRQASNRLCILLGMPTNDLAGQLQPAPIPRAPVEVAIGLPADLLRRRPDVRHAERMVAAQSAQIGVAEADLYPRLALNGFLGYAADDLRELFSPRSFTGIIVPTLQWNVLNYGRIANNIRLQDARLEEQSLLYQKAVLTAGREVEDSLVGFLEAQQQAIRLQESVQEAERSVELVIIQFRGGVTDFNRVYNTQTVMVTQQDQLATTEGDIALNLIGVYRALGGGWQCLMQGCDPPFTVTSLPSSVTAPTPAKAAEELPPPAGAK